MLQQAKKETYVLHRKLFEENRPLRHKYQDLIVGRRGWWPLIKYELVLLLSSWVPGALGLLLRSKLYPLLLGSVGKGVIFGANVTLRHPHKIHIGDHTVIDDNCVLDAKGTDNHGINIGRDVFIGRNTIVYCKDGDIAIGDNAIIAFNCEIFSANFVRLGAYVQMGAYAYLNGGDHTFEKKDVPIARQERIGRGIVLEEGAWIGAGAIVLDGVTVGKHAIVGAGAVVTKDAPAESISGGIPATVLRMR